MVIILVYPLPWLITGIVTRVTRRVALVEHPSSSGFMWDSCCSIVSFLHSILYIIVSPFVLFLLTTVPLLITPLVSSNFSYGGTICINTTIGSLTCTHICKNGHCIANSEIFQLFHGDNKLIFNEMMMRSALHYCEHA